jgi:hypothetical protein
MPVPSGKERCTNRAAIDVLVGQVQDPMPAGAPQRKVSHTTGETFAKATPVSYG